MMKKFAFIIATTCLCFTACDFRQDEADEEARAGTVNVEKGVAPEMWSSEVDLTPIPQNVIKSTPEIPDIPEIQEEMMAEEAAVQPLETEAPAPEVKERKKKEPVVAPAAAEPEPQPQPQQEESGEEG